MSEPRQLLLVDDDSAMRQMLAALFEEQGYAVHQADSARAAIEYAKEIDFDAVLSDIRMPGKTGIEMVGEMRSLRPRTPVILMTAFGSIDSAIGAMRAGAFDYITKPFEPDTALITVERALEQRALEQENQRLRRAVDQTTSFGDLIGASPAMRDIFALIRKVAHGRSSVLITGDSGTGKEVVARTLHYHGARADQPFIPVNCSAIPEGLLESELFGHVKGAFTGAPSHRSVACSKKPAAARSSSTKSATWAPGSRASCCAYFRTARFARSAAISRLGWMSGSSRRLTRI